MLVKILNTQIVRNPPVIGKHHSTKPKAFSDGRNGDYWETYPQITQDGLKLQLGLLAHKNKSVQHVMFFDSIVMKDDNV